MVKACVICGFDIHMSESDDEGYIWYLWLTAFFFAVRGCRIGHDALDHQENNLKGSSRKYSFTRD